MKPGDKLAWIEEENKILSTKSFVRINIIFKVVKRIYDEQTKKTSTKP
jgi:hypothetical protein